MQKVNFNSRKADGRSVSLNNRLSVRVAALHDAAAAADETYLLSPYHHRRRSYACISHWTSLLDARLI